MDVQKILDDYEVKIGKPLTPDERIAAENLGNLLNIIWKQNRTSEEMSLDEAKTLIDKLKNEIIKLRNERTKCMLIDINEACHAIIKFIGTDEYKNILNSINDDAKEAGFITGLSIAMSIVMSKCNTYVFKENEYD